MSNPFLGVGFVATVPSSAANDVSGVLSELCNTYGGKVLTDERAVVGPGVAQISFVTSFDGAKIAERFQGVTRVELARPLKAYAIGETNSDITLLKVADYEKYGKSPHPVRNGNQLV